MDDIRQLADGAVAANISEAWETVNQLVNGIFAWVPRVMTAMVAFAFICPTGVAVLSNIHLKNRHR